jgi:Flp pilus assembly protein TadD
MATIAEALALGAQHDQAGQFDRAEQIYRQVLQAQPGHVEALHRLGTVVFRQGRFQEAARTLRQAYTLSPQSPQISRDLRAATAACHNERGFALQQQNRLDEARACYLEALKVEPACVAAHGNLGNVLQLQEKLADAERSYRRVLDFAPNSAQALTDLAYLAQMQGRYDEALELCRRAIELDPQFGEAHGTLGIILLKLGKFAEGWPEYEWRFKSKDFVEQCATGPRWDGALLAGRAILLRCEQGLGDAVQFIRYAQPVKDRGGRVIVECPRALARLVATCPGVDEVVAQGDAVPEHDVQAPLLSLPGIFRTTLDNVPNRVPYLFADDDLVASWKTELGREKLFKVGIAWQGNPTFRRDRLRSIPLEHFAQLARVEGVRLFGLQFGAGREQLAKLAEQVPLVDLGGRLGEFHETAAIVRNLDLVISSDSAIVHLAGSLGVPVWVALSTAADWRWMVDRPDSPWYPTMRLFRQTALGDWQGVFARIASALADAV